MVVLGTGSCCDHSANPKPFLVHSHLYHCKPGPEIHLSLQRHEGMLSASEDLVLERCMSIEMIKNCHKFRFTFHGNNIRGYNSQVRNVNLELSASKEALEEPLDL